jgi:hypothetical protein
MALNYLLFYYKPVIAWFENKIAFFEDFLLSCKHLIINSSIIKTKVFISHSVAATLTMIFTGSLFLSLSPLHIRFYIGIDSNNNLVVYWHYILLILFINYRLAFIANVIFDLYQIVINKNPELIRLLDSQLQVG